MIINPCFSHYAHVNIAEHFTQPVDYFEFGDEVTKVPFTHSVADYVDSTVSMIVVGGGGLVSHQRTNAWLWLKALVERASPTVPIVIWGMGLNDHGRLDHNYHDTLSDLERRPNVLIGLRDSFYRCYVPCASCLRPEFDATFRIQHDIGLYVHHAFNIQLPYPTMSNRVIGDPVPCFRRVIEFLGSCDVMLTNTYHGAYWATLLNRKVVVITPFSNKFLGFQHEPVIIQDVNWLAPAIKIARRYPEALSQSRAANGAFYERVLALERVFAK